MTTMIAALVLGLHAAPYAPSGPVIRFTMASGKSFSITTDPQNSPLTVKHILGLVKEGFYNRQRVHRVENWVTQWGAPASRNKPLDSDKVGDGGSGHPIPKFEAAQDVDFVRGMVGIASEGLQLPGDSQIFILKADATRLYKSYAVVGKVTDGMAVVDTIKRGDRISKAVVVGGK